MLMNTEEGNISEIHKQTNISKASKQYINKQI